MNNSEVLPEEVLIYILEYFGYELTDLDCIVPLFESIEIKLKTGWKIVIKMG